MNWDVSQAFWKPHRIEKKALANRIHVESFGRVDQIWPWLAEHHGNLTAVDAPHAAHPERFSYLELSERISIAAAAFYALGLEKGQVVGFFAENSPRWLVADQALMRLDVANAVRGASAPIDELRYILNDSSSTALVIQNAELWKKLELSESESKKLKFVLQLEGPTAEGVLCWDDFLSLGTDKRELPVNSGRGLDSAKSVIATVLYTSGTTGKPKGVPLNHSNLLHQIKSLVCVAYPPPGSPVLSVLPIWHAYERSAEYYFFSCGCSQTYTTIKQLKNDLPRVRPIVMVTVPRLWEAVKAGFDDAIKKMPLSRKALINTALANSHAYTKSRRITRNLMLEPASLIRRFGAFCESTIRWPFHGFASTFIWPKVLLQLCGGRLRFPINGGGAIAPHVDAFFEALGVEMLVGYGLTETSPVVSCRRPWRNIRATSGPPLPNTEFQIVDIEKKTLLGFSKPGRVLVRGPQVMSGYLGKPVETSKVLNDQGWFDTGDIGMLLPDGSLVLTGRAKDTIVLSSGENIEPGPLEEALLASPLLDQIMLVGQDERQLGALIVPNFENIRIWLEEKGLTSPNDLGSSPGDTSLRKMLKAEVNTLLSKRKGSRKDERVMGVALVEPFSIENGLLTQTLKQRRDQISTRYKSAIEVIFRG